MFDEADWVGCGVVYPASRLYMLMVYFLLSCLAIPAMHFFRMGKSAF